MIEQMLSTAPNGESFPLPKQEDYAKEFKRLQTLVKKHRKEGREIVVVMGVGFVGAVMAGIVADAVQKPGINGDILGNREAIDKSGGVRSFYLASRSDAKLKALTPVIPPGAAAKGADSASAATPATKAA